MENYYWTQFRNQWIMKKPNPGGYISITEPASLAQGTSCNGGIKMVEARIPGSFLWDILFLKWVVNKRGATTSWIC